MPRKVKIPLLMSNTPVSTIDDLKKHFDPIAVLRYYNQNLLQHWLRMHHEGEICDKVEELDKDAPDFASRLCQILLGDESKECPVTLADIAYEDEKLERLKKLTNDAAFLSKVSDIALTQEDLEQLYRIGKEHIILYNGVFKINPHHSGVKYTKHADGTVQVVIPAKDCADFMSKGFELDQITFGWDISGISADDEVYQAEQMMMTGRKWKDALPILEAHAGEEHRNPRALVLLEIYYEAQKDKCRDFAKIGQRIGSVQSGIMRKKTDAELKLMETLAQNGDPLSQALYGLACINSDRKEKGLEQLKAAAERCPWAKYQLGKLLKEENKDRSCQYFKEAAEIGFIPAIQKMCCLSSDEKERKRWSAEAEKQGASPDPGLLFTQGEECLMKEQFTEAAQLYEQAAMFDYAPAQMRLGCCYLNGKGVQQDQEIGLSYLDKAIAQNDAPAVFAKGCWQFHHNSIENAIVLGMFHRASVLGYAPAKCAMSFIYQEGLLGAAKRPEVAAILQLETDAGLSDKDGIVFLSLDPLALPRADSPFDIAYFVQKKRETKEIHPGKVVLMRIFGNKNQKLPSNFDIERVSGREKEYEIVASVMKIPSADFEQLISYLISSYTGFNYTQTGFLAKVYTTQIEIEILNETYSMNVTLRSTVGAYSASMSRVPKDYTRISFANIKRIESEPSQSDNNAETSTSIIPVSFTDAAAILKSIIQEALELKSKIHPNSASTLSVHINSGKTIFRYSDRDRQVEKEGTKLSQQQVYGLANYINSKHARRFNVGMYNGFVSVSAYAEDSSMIILSNIGYNW